MSLLEVKGNIVAAFPMKGWYVCMYVKLFSNVFLRVGYVYTCLYVVVFHSRKAVVSTYVGSFSCILHLL